MSPRIAGLLLAAWLGTPGCGSVPAQPAPTSSEHSPSRSLQLLGAESSVLLACDELEVMQLSSERGPAPDETVLHGYPVLAHVRLRGAPARELAGDILHAIDDAHYEGDSFLVGYAVRAHKDERTVDLVLSFPFYRVLALVPGGWRDAGLSPGLEKRLGELLGNRDREFAGRTVGEWCSVLGSNPIDIGEREIEGIKALALSLAWERNPWSVQAVLEWIDDAAAHAIPELVMLLDCEDLCWCWPTVLAVIRDMGPVGAEARPALLELSERSDLERSTFRLRSHDQFGGEAAHAPQALGKARADEIRRLAREALAAIESE